MTFKQTFMVMMSVPILLAETFLLLYTLEVGVVVVVVVIQQSVSSSVVAYGARPRKPLERNAETLLLLYTREVVPSVRRREDVSRPKDLAPFATPDAQRPSFCECSRHARGTRRDVRPRLERCCHVASGRLASPLHLRQTCVGVTPSPSCRAPRRDATRRGDARASASTDGSSRPCARPARAAAGCTCSSRASTCSARSSRGHREVAHALTQTFGIKRYLRYKGGRRLDRSNERDRSAGLPMDTCSFWLPPFSIGRVASLYTPQRATFDNNGSSLGATPTDMGDTSWLP